MGVEQEGVGAGGVESRGAYKGHLGGKRTGHTGSAQGPGAWARGRHKGQAGWAGILAAGRSSQLAYILDVLKDCDVSVCQ